MPLAEQGPQAKRKQTLYTDLEVRKLSAYIQSVGGGPDIPTVDLTDAEPAARRRALPHQLRLLPQLRRLRRRADLRQVRPRARPGDADPDRLGDALRPRVHAGVRLDDVRQAERDSIVRYVKYVTNAQDPGGNRIGHLGPIPEGLVAWLVGIGGLIGVTLWIGAKA